MTRHLVATSPGLAHAAWLAWRDADTTVHMIGPPGQLAHASRMHTRLLPEDVSDQDLAASIDGPVLPCDERAHVMCLDAGLDVLGHQDADVIRGIADKATYPDIAARCGFQTPDVIPGRPSAPGRYIEKPRWGFGGEGVHAWRPGDDRLPASVLMPYIDGPDIDASIAAVDGEVVASTAEQTKGPGIRAYFRDEVVEDAVHRIAKGLRYTGLLHVDMRLRDGVPWVVDINPRIWASHWMAAAVGMDFAKAYLDALEGRAVTFRHRDAVFAPPWSWHQARRAGRIAPTAPLRAQWSRLADPGILRAMRRYAARPPHIVHPWPTSF